MQSIYNFFVFFNTQSDKEKKMIRDENYYQICGWMITRLGLRGTALNVFAIIYGFTQDGESEFKGSRQYLSDFTGATRPTIDKALSELIEHGLIIKNSDTINNITFNRYKVDLNAIKNFIGCKETLQGGCKETLPNNNNIDNIDIKKERKTATQYDAILEAKVKNEEIRETLREFIKMRAFIKKPMTSRALELLIGKLKKMAGQNKQKALDILNNSIVNCWQDIYLPKNEPLSTQEEQRQREERKKKEREEAFRWGEIMRKQESIMRNLNEN